MRKVHTLFLLSLLFLLAACSGRGAPEGPPEIIYGSDVGDHCGMIINEPRFAAAYRAADGTERRFDDIGDMLLYLEEKGEAVAGHWVHDFNTEAWVEVDAATFVHNPELVTPMGWGLAAFASQEAAETYVSVNGGTVVTSWPDLRAGVASGKITPMMAANHGMESHGDMEMDGGHDMEHMNAP